MRQFAEDALDRKIIHIDMDAFYAAVEQKDDPGLKGKPVIVGGLSPRGVVSAASYEARKFGVRSAMPMRTARQLCPHGHFKGVRMERYREISREIQAIFEEYTDLIEPIALDESFLDVTENKPGIPYASTIAREIKEKILRRTGLTASAGVGPNKFIAKLASGLEKPDGLVVVRPEDVRGFLKDLPISKMWGVGAVTEKRLRKLGINTIGELAALSPELLNREFGKIGLHLLELSRGEDPSPVNPNRETKSVSHEVTFQTDLRDMDAIKRNLAHLAAKVEERLKRKGLRGRTVTLKVKYKDFRQITRSVTSARRTESREEIYRTGLSLLEKTEAGRRPVRLIGLGVSNFERSPESAQLPLFRE